MYEYLRDNLIEFADHLTTLNVPASYSKLIYDTVHAIDDMNDVIKNGNWIPVDTTLPGVGQNVLVTYIGAISGEPKVEVAHLNHRGKWVWDGAGSEVKVEITHWRPSPKPAEQPKAATTPKEINDLLYNNPFGGPK